MVHTQQLPHHEGGAEMCCGGWCCAFGNSPEFEQLQLTRKQQELGRAVYTGTVQILFPFHLPTLQHSVKNAASYSNVKVTSTDLKR